MLSVTGLECTLSQRWRDTNASPGSSSSKQQLPAVFPDKNSSFFPPKRTANYVIFCDGCARLENPTASCHYEPDIQRNTPNQSWYSHNRWPSPPSPSPSLPPVELMESHWDRDVWDVIKYEWKTGTAWEGASPVLSEGCATWGHD